jgi:hypothetical protein
MTLSQSHDLDYEFGRLTSIESIHFFVFLIEYFFSWA